MSSPLDHQPPPPPQKRFMPPPPQEKAEVPEHALASLTMRPKSPAVGEARFTERCSNCERPLHVEGRDAAVRDAAGVYCSKNCSWSMAVDPGGSRLRAARRAKMGKPVKKRKKRVSLKFDGSDEEGKHVDVEGKESGTTYSESNAMFEFHQMMFGGIDLGEEDEDEDEDEKKKKDGEGQAHGGKGW